MGLSVAQIMYATYAAERGAVHKTREVLDAIDLAYLQASESTRQDKTDL